MPNALCSSAAGRGRRDGLMTGLLLFWLVSSSEAEPSMVAMVVLNPFSFVELTTLQKTVIPFADHLLFGVVSDKKATRVEFAPPFFY